MEGNVGIVGSLGSEFGGGPLLGGDILYRYALVEVGFRADVVPNLVGGSRYTFAGVAGVGTHSRGWLGGDFLLEAGGRHYDDVGSTNCFLCFVDKEPGVSGAVSYVGVRAGVTVHSRWNAKREVSPIGGLWLFVNHDLTHRSITESYSHSNLGFGSTLAQRAIELGGATELGVMFRVGFDVRL